MHYFLSGFCYLIPVVREVPGEEFLEQARFFGMSEPHRIQDSLCC